MAAGALQMPVGTWQYMVTVAVTLKALGETVTSNKLYLSFGGEQRTLGHDFQMPTHTSEAWLPLGCLLGVSLVSAFRFLTATWVSLDVFRCLQMLVNGSRTLQLAQDGCRCFHILQMASDASRCLQT
jgi:hypothetical protein